eukprot:TRINITY_DN6510_c0_g1_i1.p1 TRINITY_DN6510_c0_g1~~TRINITY_DN6510_c0_g1_i1.p1  ORF type:complete len:497 (+),score=154.54 TRINITY_DN6510_c0_g1_i1:33-1523(+)
MNFIVSVLISLLVVVFAVLYRMKMNKSRGDEKKEITIEKIPSINDVNIKENNIIKNEEIVEEIVEENEQYHSPKLNTEILTLVQENVKDDIIKEKEERGMRIHPIEEKELTEDTDDTDDHLFLKENGLANSKEHKISQDESDNKLQRLSVMELSQEISLKESENTTRTKQELLQSRMKILLDSIQRDDIEKFKEISQEMIDTNFSKQKFETLTEETQPILTPTQQNFKFDSFFSVVCAFANLKFLEAALTIKSISTPSKSCILNAALRGDTAMILYLMKNYKEFNPYMRFYFNYQNKNLPLLIKEIVTLEGELLPLFNVPQIYEGSPEFKSYPFLVHVKELTFNIPTKGILKFGFHFKGNSKPLEMKWDESPNKTKTKVQKKSKKNEEEILRIVPPRKVSHVEQKYSSMFGYFNAKFAILVYQHHLLKKNTLVDTLFVEIDEINRFIHSGEMVTLNFQSGGSNKEKSLKGKVNLFFSLDTTANNSESTEKNSKNKK